MSLEYRQEFTGAYSWEHALHVTFDLRTGRQLALTDLIADLPVRLTRRMHGAISRRFGEALAEMAADISVAAERFGWNWSAKGVRFQSNPGLAEEARHRT